MPSKRRKRKGRPKAAGSGPADYSALHVDTARDDAAAGGGAAGGGAAGGAASGAHEGSNGDAAAPPRQEGGQPRERSVEVPAALPTPSAASAQPAEQPQIERNFDPLAAQRTEPEAEEDSASWAGSGLTRQRSDSGSARSTGGLSPSAQISVPLTPVTQQSGATPTSVGKLARLAVVNMADAVEQAVEAEATTLLAGSGGPSLSVTAASGDEAMDPNAPSAASSPAAAPAASSRACNGESTRGGKGSLAAVKGAAKTPAVEVEPLGRAGMDGKDDAAAGKAKPEATAATVVNAAAVAAAAAAAAQAAAEAGLGEEEHQEILKGLGADLEQLPAEVGSSDAASLPEDDFIRYYVKGEDPLDGAERPCPVGFLDFIWQDLGMENEDPQGFSSKNASVEDDVFNFMRVPMEIEKLLFFGLFLCADSLLFMLVFLPLRVLRALLLLLSTALLPARWSRRELRFHRTQFYDLLRASIIAVAFVVLVNAPMSRIYHYVRGQTFIKLYVIFNMLDIFDRLMCSFGQDILDSLFYMTKTSPHAIGRIAFRLALGILYATLHSLLYFVRLITLNVAINSSSNALMTILISNNFVELKGSVFKRFAEQNLFQITCSDIVERFELFVFMGLTAMQHPESWSDFFYSSALYVCGCELLVDWVKHAFITKFNRIHFSSYGNFLEALCRDIAPVSGSKQPYATSQRLGGRPVDHSQAVAQRIGLATLPLTCVVLRFVWANIPRTIRADPLAPAHLVCFALTFLCLLLLKNLINVSLRGYACSVLMSRERLILRRSSPRLSSLPSTPTEKELQKAVVAKHMQKIDQLAGIRRYQIYKSRVPT